MKLFACLLLASCLYGTTSFAFEAQKEYVVATQAERLKDANLYRIIFHTEDDPKAKFSIVMDCSEGRLVHFFIHDEELYSIQLNHLWRTLRFGYWEGSFLTYQVSGSKGYMSDVKACWSIQNMTQELAEGKITGVTLEIDNKYLITNFHSN
jgi:hypothetical protein